MFGYVFAASVILTLISAWFSRHFERGRGAFIVGAFFTPFLFVGYLIYVNGLRHEFHVSRSEAGEDHGFNRLPLRNGYRLSSFYEAPSDAWIEKSSVATDSDLGLKHVQRVAVIGDTVFGETSRSGILDSPEDIFFALDMSSGTIREFGTEAELRSRFSKSVPLRHPEDVYEEALAKVRSTYFWPTVAGIPVVILAACWILARRLQQSRPAAE